MASLTDTKIYGNLQVSRDTLIGGILSTTDTTASTSKTTGAVKIAGGLGVAGDIWSTKYNDLTLTKQATGFTIAGGTTSRTLTITGDATISGGTHSGTNTGNQTITSGNGMNFTTGSGNVTITLGSPSNITSSSTNNVTSTSHTHAITGEALTRTNDTNVTLTLGGTPATGLVKATSLTLGWSGQLAVARGGTGASSVTARYALLGPTSAGAPTWRAITSADVSDATNANTANMIVKRDASGNFSAGTISAAIFNATSKRDAKDNICTYTESALGKLNQVDIVNFTFKADEKKTPHVGFIADDTDSILSGANHDHMDLGNSVGLLIKAVQELSEKNEMLEKRIEKLERSWWKKLLGRS